MVVCVHLPRFELDVAAGEGIGVAQQTLAGRPLAVAPAANGAQRVGETSAPAEARGVARGMALGEALARCPELVLVPGDPVLVAAEWERTLLALEAVGAAVEPAGPGLAYFDEAHLRGIHRTRSATIDAALEVLARPARIGVGPGRFCALACALAARSPRPLVQEGREAIRWLAGQPIGLLAFREQTAPLVEPLTRLGVRTLGELARLGRPELSDRFGAAGALAHALACGEDAPLRPRRVEESVEESMELADASSGEALERVLGVLVSRLLARGERRGRTLRAVILSARLLTGGGWRERVVFRQALADPERIWLALSLRVMRVPAPAAELTLAVERFGPPLGDQGALFTAQALGQAFREGEADGPAPRSTPVRGSGHSPSPRRLRLREAIAQVRAVAGREATLRAVCVDPDSRVPERRVVLAPFSEREVDGAARS